MEAKQEPGKFTSEFWLVIVTELITLATALKGLIPPEVALIVAASLTAVYNVLRTWRKNSAGKAAEKSPE